MTSVAQKQSCCKNQDPETASLESTIDNLSMLLISRFAGMPDIRHLWTSDTYHWFRVNWWVLPTKWNETAIISKSMFVKVSLDNSATFVADQKSYQQL